MKIRTAKRSADAERLAHRRKKLRELGWSESLGLWTRPSSCIKHTFKTAVAVEQLAGRMKGIKR